MPIKGLSKLSSERSPYLSGKRSLLPFRSCS
uniref:Uncharacterized protein n=1 Tax=Amphimedon queenslandica TaxID=400682 RepID=A0A1X7SPH4_AMPQE